MVVKFHLNPEGSCLNPSSLCGDRMFSLCDFLQVKMKNCCACVLVLLSVSPVDGWPVCGVPCHLSYDSWDLTGWTLPLTTFQLGKDPVALQVKARKLPIDV